MEPALHIKRRPLWKWALVFVASVILSLTGYILLQGLFWERDFPWVIIIATAMIIGLYALGVRLLEWHPARDLGMGKLLPHTAIGLLVGFVYMTLVMSTIVAAGCATIGHGAPAWEEIRHGFMICLAVGVGEEIIFRGVIFRQIDERWNTWTALIVSALLFGLVHMSNDGATWWSSTAIALEAGLMLGVAYKWSGTLWLPIGIHWAWNFTQGNIFGAAVSGTEAGNSVLEINAYGPDIITGGVFGPEASIVAVFFGLLLTIVFIFNYHRR